TLARLSNARSSLIHTYDPRDPRAHSGNSSPGTYLDSHRRAFAKYVPDVQAYLAAEASNPTESLVSFINDFETDLLVTPVREAHAKELSTTSSLIRKSRAPVLVVRESASLSHVT